MSKPDDLPADVWAKALAAQDAAIAECKAQRLMYPFPTCNGKAVLDVAIARAILSGREDQMRKLANG